MKSIGIVRKIDELGRIVLPMELRKKFNIKEKDDIEIFTEGNKIVLKKFDSQIKECRNCAEHISVQDRYCKNCGLKQ